MKDEYVNKIKELMKMSMDINCVPVGAIVVKDDKIIGVGNNTRNITNNITDHAEIIAINNAAKVLGDWRLDGCELYVSLYPCNMCLEVIKQARISNVYYCSDSYSINRVNNNALTQTKIRKIDDFVDSERMLKLFFENLRK